MPAQSKAQARFAAMSRTASGRAALRASGKKPMPARVASEYSARGKGSMAALPGHVRKK